LRYRALPADDADDEIQALQKLFEIMGDLAKAACLPIIPAAMTSGPLNTRRRIHKLKRYQAFRHRRGTFGKDLGSTSPASLTMLTMLTMISDLAKVN
jgi:hypothetical protein